MRRERGGEGCYLVYHIWYSCDNILSQDLWTGQRRSLYPLCSKWSSKVYHKKLKDRMWIKRLVFWNPKSTWSGKNPFNRSAWETQQVQSVSWWTGTRNRWARWNPKVLADDPDMSFVFVCWQIKIQTYISWVGKSTTKLQSAHHHNCFNAILWPRLPKVALFGPKSAVFGQKSPYPEVNLDTFCFPVGAHSAARQAVFMAQIA